jgi:hypothetical protein
LRRCAGAERSLKKARRPLLAARGFIMNPNAIATLMTKDTVPSDSGVRLARTFIKIAHRR